MKKYIKLLFTALLIASCSEEVVLNDIENSIPRLVVEANIDWDKNDAAASKTQSIKLTMSTSYYNQDYPVVNNAVVTVTNNANESMGTFVYNAEEGLYIATDFKEPTFNETYSLKIELDGEVYTASDEYTSIADTNHITQSLNKDLDSDGVITVAMNVENEIDVDNFYMFKIVTPTEINLLPEYSSADDSLLNEEEGENNYDFDYFDEELEEGMELEISLFGVSRRYNNYLIKVLLNAEGGSSGPFATAPATIIGNVLNETDEENRAYGFFSVNQFYTINYTILEEKEEDQITEL